MGYFWGWGRVQRLFWGLLIQTNNFCFLSFALFLLYHVVLSLCGGMGGGGGVGGGIPSNYLVSTQLQLWLFCCWGCGCWAVTIFGPELGITLVRTNPVYHLKRVILFGVLVSQ